MFMRLLFCDVLVVGVDLGYVAVCGFVAGLFVFDC